MGDPNSRKKQALNRLRAQLRKKKESLADQFDFKMYVAFVFKEKVIESGHRAAQVAVRALETVSARGAASAAPSAGLRPPPGGALPSGFVATCVSAARSEHLSLG